MCKQGFSSLEEYTSVLLLKEDKILMLTPLLSGVEILAPKFVTSHQQNQRLFLGRTNHCGLSFQLRQIGGRGPQNFIPSAESFRRNWKYHLLMGSVRPTSVRVGQKPGRGASCSPLLSQPFSVVGTPLTKPNPAFDLHISRKMLLTLGELGGTWWDLRPMSVSRGTQENMLPWWWGESCPDPAVPTPGQVLSDPRLALVPPSRHLLWWSAGLRAAALIAAH